VTLQVRFSRACGGASGAAIWRVREPKGGAVVGLGVELNTALKVPVRQIRR